jgi:tripartite-type tricarboxylate transporter receptor subunit TctC
VLLKISTFAIPAAAMALAMAPPPASADAVSDFYKGNRIAFVVAVPPGGGYDLNTRVLARHMARHIPGNPATIVQNMPGAGGAKAANYMYNVAPKNGTVISMPLSSIIVAQLLRPEKIKYDAGRFNWLGTITTMTDVLVTWHTAGVKTIDDARKKQVIFGTSSKNSMGYQEPALLNALVGTKIKVVLGYRGGKAITLAMERGEVQGRVNQWASWRVQKPKWLKDGTIVPLVQIGPKDPEYMNVPAMIDLVKTEHDRSLVRILHMTLNVGRSIYTGPGAPRARVEGLRRAFDSALKDPAFLKEAKAKRLVLNPVRGVDVQKFVAKSLKTSEQTIKAFKAAIGL